MQDFDRKLTVKEMNILDQNTTDYGVPVDFLMECAGYSAAMTIVNKFNLNKKPNDSKILIICGTGNNGGDGFVIARHLAALKINATVILVGDPTDIKTQHALLNWKIICNLFLNIKINIIRDSSFFTGKDNNQLQEIEKSNIIIDCLLGTGVKGKIREPIKSAIEFINSLKKSKNNPKCNIISIDIPSGMDPDTGKISDICVECDLLITFHREKIGLQKSSLRIPEIIVNPIGIPEESDLFIGTGNLKTNIKNRNSNNYKGQHGKVLVIGGSEQYSGAPALSAMAALAMDMDLVIVYAPNSISNVIRSYSPNLIVKDGKSKNICIEDLEDIFKLIDWADSIIIGPGIGLSQSTKDAVGKVIKYCIDKGKPVVVDADAIKISANLKDILKNNQVIFTPHAAEFLSLTGKNLPNDEKMAEKLQIIESSATELKSIIVLKGKWDYISDGNRTKINRTGVPEMAVGGTGDILTGIIGALCALGIDRFEAACIGAYISGKLGEEFQLLHANEEGGYIKTFKSSDLIGIIPIILAKFLKNR